MIIIALLALGSTSNILTLFLILVHLPISLNGITFSVLCPRSQIHEVSEKLSNKLSLQPQGKQILFSLETSEVWYPPNTPLKISAPDWSDGVQKSSTLKIWVTGDKNSHYTWEIQKLFLPEMHFSIEDFFLIVNSTEYNFLFNSKKKKILRE